jgi:CRISPR-associated endoribonuclease Cas6
MYTLLSLVLALNPTTSTRLAGFYGAEVRGWLFSELARYDPGLVDRLHDETDPNPKPYTVSGLIVPRAGRRLQDGELRLVPHTTCLIRITSLDDTISEILLDHVLPGLPRRIRLKWNEFSLRGPSQDNAWWGEMGWDDFASMPVSREDVSVTLDFASPTAFRSQGADQPLPVPGQVFRSLWQRWNFYAPEALQIDDLWPKFAEQCIVVSDFRLRSLKVRFKKGEKGAATGCTGQVTYRLLEAHRCGEYEPFRPGAELVLQTLAEFALYSGVGHHTTVGLGQSRRLLPSRIVENEYDTDEVEIDDDQ